MIPTNNGTVSPCDPISSNCVIWQGPDIACIDLCKGDTISIVVAKLAEKLCDIIDATCECNPDLSGLDLKCIPAPPEANPNLDKEQYERKKNDPDFKEKLRAKNAIAYQRRKARLIAQKLAEQSKGLETLD